MAINNTPGQFEEAPFNMAMLFYQELSSLRRMKSQAFIHGEMETYWDCLEELYSMISFRIKAPEKKIIQNKFSKLPIYFADPCHAFKIKPALREIDMELISIMNANGMIFPNKQSSGLRDIEKRFK